MASYPDESDLTTAVAAVNQALTRTIDGSEDRLMSIVCLGIVAHEWYSTSELEQDRDDILQKRRSVLSQISLEETVINVWYTTLMKMLRIKFGRTKDIEALKQSVEHGRKAFQDYTGRLLSARDDRLIRDGEIPSEHLNELPNSGDLSFFLCSLLHDLYKETLDPILLKEAELYSELAINNATSLDSAETFSHQRFSTLLLLYEVTESRVYLEKAKSLAMSRLAHFAMSSRRMKWLQFLGDALSQEHSPLNESIRIYREALEIEPSEDRECEEITLTLRHGLADSLFRRSHLTFDAAIKNSLPDVDEALANVNFEMDLLPRTEFASDEALRSTIFGLRGQIYLARFQRSGSIDDVDHAVANLVDCRMRFTPESPHQGEISYSLELAYLTSEREDRRD